MTLYDHKKLGFAAKTIGCEYFPKGEDEPYLISRNKYLTLSGRDLLPYLIDRLVKDRMVTVMMTEDGIVITYINRGKSQHLRAEIREPFTFPYGNLSPSETLFNGLIDIAALIGEETV